MLKGLEVEKTCSADCDVQKRYIERAPGCHEPPPVPFQHRKGNCKSAPKPGTAEEARHQAQQAKALASVGPAPTLHPSKQSCSLLANTAPESVWAALYLKCITSGLILELSLPRSQEASLVYDAKCFGMLSALGWTSHCLLCRPSFAESKCGKVFESEQAVSQYVKYENSS